MRRTAVLLVALATLLGGCATETKERTPSTTIPRWRIELLASELVEFDSCSAFLDHTKNLAAERVGPWGFDGERRLVLSTLTAAVTQQAVQAGLQASALTPGLDYSTTNVQELEVDEPDTLKTDGHRVLAVADRVLYHVDISSDPPVLVSSLPLVKWGGKHLWNHQFFMLGDTAVAMASGLSESGLTRTLVFQIDLSDPQQIRVVNTLMVDADLIAARLVGNRVALALVSRPAITDDFTYSKSRSESDKSRATELNQEVIEQSTLEDWAPRYVLTSGPDESSTDGSLIDCSSSYAPQEFSGADLLSVLTFDMTGTLDVESVATVMAGGDTVYASTDHLYVANHRWIDWEETDAEEVEGMTTHIHRFDISSVGSPVYEASGSVEGFLLDQFAMSEYDGYLRVASTNAPAWWGEEVSSESRVDVLESDRAELRIVASVTGLGRGEFIYAVRFMGDVGYVVTFREVDPLYTIDLSDPTAPRVVGELKILGYSAYLHPVGEGLLLGVGQDADEEGRVSGTQMSLFDVSDIERPVRSDRLALPERSVSGVEYDHRAFLYWPPTRTVVLPIGWSEHDQESDDWTDFHEALIVQVGSEGMEHRGSIEHQPGVSGRDRLPSGYTSPFPIERALVVGDTLFTLSVAGLKGNDLADLSETSWVRFPREE